jgi:hypothetical protein
MKLSSLEDNENSTANKRALGTARMMIRFLRLIFPSGFFAVCAMLTHFVAGGFRPL